MSAGQVMRVAFDLSTVAHAVGGVSRYLLSLSRGLTDSAAGKGVDLVTVDVPASHPGVDPPAEAELVLRDPFYLGIPFARRIPIRGGWERRSRSDRLGRLTGHPRLYHHGGVQPFAPPGSISVVTVYDLSALEHPEWHTRETVEFAEREERLIRAGSRVAAISPWTARQVSARFGLDPDSIGVIGGAADDTFSPGEPARSTMLDLGLVPGGYLLHVGNFVPRKNIPMLVEAYRRSRGAGLRLPLVMVGKGAWGGIDVDDGDDVKVLTGIDDGGLVDLYRGARAVLVPSECEGLGLPVLEALACGTPVIASTAGALPETLGGHGVLLAPGDGAAWSAAMLDIEDRGRCDSLRTMALGAPRPTWNDCAERLCDFYLGAAVV